MPDLVNGGGVEDVRAGGGTAGEVVVRACGVVEGGGRGEAGAAQEKVLKALGYTVAKAPPHEGSAEGNRWTGLKRKKSGMRTRGMWRLEDETLAARNGVARGQLARALARDRSAGSVEGVVGVRGDE